jgi:hypothetical protein
MRSNFGSEGELQSWKCAVCGWKNNPRNRVCGGLVGASLMSRKFGCGASYQRQHKADASYESCVVDATGLSRLPPALQTSLRPWSLRHGQAVEVWHNGKLVVGNVMLRSNSIPLLENENEDYIQSWMKSQVPVLVFHAPTVTVLPQLKSESNGNDDSPNQHQMDKKSTRRSGPQRRRGSHFEGPHLLHHKSSYNFDQTSRELVYVPFDQIIGAWGAPTSDSSIEIMNEVGDEGVEVEQVRRSSSSMSDDSYEHLMIFTPKSIKDWQEVHHSAEILMNDCNKRTASSSPSPSRLNVNDEVGALGSSNNGNDSDDDIETTRRNIAHKLWRQYQTEARKHEHPRQQNWQSPFGNNISGKRRRSMLDSDTSLGFDGQLTTLMVSCFLLTGKLELSHYRAMAAITKLELPPTLYAAVNYASAKLLSMFGLAFFKRRLSFNIRVDVNSKPPLLHNLMAPTPPKPLSKSPSPSASSSSPARTTITTTTTTTTPKPPGDQRQQNRYRLLTTAASPISSTFLNSLIGLGVQLKDVKRIEQEMVYADDVAKKSIMKNIKAHESRTIISDDDEHDEYGDKDEEEHEERQQEQSHVGNLIKLETTSHSSSSEVKLWVSGGGWYVLNNPRVNGQ